MPDTPMTEIEREAMFFQRGYRAGRAEALRRVEAAVLAIADEIDAEAREWDSGTLESFAVRLRAALVIRDTPPEET